MDKHKKNILLQNCNTFEINQLINIVETGEITIEEFKEAGLDHNKVKQIMDSFAILELNKSSNEKKKELIDSILKKKSTASIIKDCISKGDLTFEDLSNEGLDIKTLNSLKHYCSANRFTIFKNISDLPPMEEGRTDLYFVGLPGTGKSTMLAGLLSIANKEGVLMPDTYNNDGAIFQTQLISDLNRGVLPKATASGSYNYIALSLKDESNIKHPFNVIEVPGELYVSMFNNPNISDFLNYINNNNKKILVFVIDSLAHDRGYVDSGNQLDQNLVYVNILNMLKNNGVLEQTDAIYVVANKFDAIKENRYPFDNRQHSEIALEFLQNEFKNLINNCIDSRDESNNKFKIKILPFSIGDVCYEDIVNNLNVDYSKEVIENLLSDSFVVRGSRFKLFNNRK